MLSQRHNRYKFLASILMFLLILGSCRKEEPVENDSSNYYSGWDTVINDQGNVYPDNNMFLRAVLNNGDPYRISLFFKKFPYKQVITVGYIGGSITKGALATSTDKNYASLTAYFLSKAFPSKNFEIINCGIGSTGSIYGCGRVDDDLLKFNPDLIVIEFSVNDQSGDSAMIKGTMEGLIRKCLKSDALVVMLVSRYRYGNSPITQNIHVGLGKHYDIPVISIGDAIDPLLQSAALEWDYFYADDIHPNNNGHFLSANLIYKCLIEQYIKLRNVNVIINMPPPLYNDIYENSTLLKSDHLDFISANNGWSVLYVENNRVAFESVHAGDELSFSASWRQATFFYEFGPDFNALAEVSVDGIPIDTIDNKFVGGYNILQHLQLFEQTVPTIRNIRIRNLTEETFKISYLMYCR